MEQNSLFKLFITNIVFAILITCLNLPIYASITESTNTGSITVKGLESGVTVNAYRLTTVNYNYTADQPESTTYTWNNNVKTWIDNNYSDYSDPQKFFESVESNSEVAKEFYSKLASAIKGGTITLTPKKQEVQGTPSYPVTDSKLKNSVTFENCQMGTYLILIENGYMIYTPSVINLTPSYNNTSKEWELKSPIEVTLKATRPQVTKKITDEVKVDDNYGSKDDILFTIVGDIPNYEEGSTVTNYYISDVLSSALTLKSDSIEIYGVNGSTTTKLATGFTITTANAKRPNNLGDATFSIQFNYNDIKLYEKIKVIYKTKLSKSDSTKIGSEGNSNTVYFDYSNNPYDATSFTTQESKAKVYTYGVEITKVDKKDTTKTLTGAQFSLLSEGNTLYFVKTGDGVYYEANSTDDGATTILAVDNQGKLHINGLDEGTYSLKELKAPNGYNVATEDQEIVILDHNLDGNIDDTTSGIFSVTLPNSQGFQLPVTGGVGTIIFISCGVVLIGIGVILLIVALKKKKK